MQGSLACNRFQEDTMQNIRQNTYTKLIILTFLVLTLAPQAWANSKTVWHTDVDTAQQLAVNEDKHVLINFTGSDWCPWCVKLDANVFSTSEFAEFAATELVLVKADFPQKEQLSQAQAAANQKLARKYAVRGFPTIVVLDPQGELVGTTGFRQGSAASYIEHLKELMD